MHRLLTLSGALCALQIITVAAQDTSCVAECANQVRGDFLTLGCVHAEDAPCLCGNPGFSSGITECASDSCGATDVDVRGYLTSSFCAAFPPPESAPSSAAPSPSTPAETTSPAPEVPSSTSEPVTEETESPSSTSEPAPETTSSAETTSETPTPSTTQASTTSSPATNEPTSTPTEVAGGLGDDEESEEKEEDEEDQDSGLSEAASIGIGVGVGAAAIAVAGVFLCLFLRNRKRQNPGAQTTVEISRPLPMNTGAGRNFSRPGGRAEGRPDSYEKYQTDIEMTTHRYDDMPPRQEPRTMV